MFKKKEINHLLKLRKDFLENVSRIKPDIAKYHEVAFSKFVYQFHASISQILRTDKNLTLDEIVEELKNLSSMVYWINKNIKSKEDQILGENDKKRFNEIKKEIDSLSEEKEYYATLEKNIAKNSLIFQLKDIADTINKLGFSGQQFTKEEASQLIDNSIDFIKKITTIQEQNKDNNMLSGLMSKIKTKEKTTEKEDSSIPDTKVERAILPDNFHLKEEEKEYLKSQVGEEYYNQYVKPVIEFIEIMKGKHTIGEIEKIYKEKYWRDGMDEIFRLLYEAMNKQDYADEEDVKEQEIEDAHNFQLSDEEKRFMEDKVNPEFFKNHVEPVVNFIDNLNGKYSLGQIEKAYREQVWREEFETTFKLLYDIVKKRKG